MRKSVLLIMIGMCYVSFSHAFSTDDRFVVEEVQDQQTLRQEALLKKVEWKCRDDLSEEAKCEADVAIAVIQKYILDSKKVFSQLSEMDKLLKSIKSLGEYSVLGECAFAKLCPILYQEAGRRGDDWLLDELYNEYFDYLTYTSGQKTALMYAASQGREKCVEKLLQRG